MYKICLWGYIYDDDYGMNSLMNEFIYFEFFIFGLGFYKYYK